MKHSSRSNKKLRWKISVAYSWRAFTKSVSAEKKVLYKDWRFEEIVLNDRKLLITTACIINNIIKYNLINTHNNTSSCIKHFYQIPFLSEWLLSVAGLSPSSAGLPPPSASFCFWRSCIFNFLGSNKAAVFSFRLAFAFSS